MEYSEWNKQFENKLTFFEFIANQDKSTIEEIEKYIRQIFTGNIIHLGDCTNHPCSCDLCTLENFLIDYRKYYFNGTFRDKDHNGI